MRFQGLVRPVCFAFLRLQKANLAHISGVLLVLFSRLVLKSWIGKQEAGHSAGATCASARASSFRCSWGSLAPGREFDGPGSLETRGGRRMETLRLHPQSRIPFSAGGVPQGLSSASLPRQRRGLWETNCRTSWPLQKGWASPLFEHSVSTSVPLLSGRRRLLGATARHVRGKRGGLRFPFGRAWAHQTSRGAFGSSQMRNGLAANNNRDRHRHVRT